MNWDKLKDVMPIELVADFISAMNKYEINTYNRASHFIAQCKHESANFKTFTENLNYGSVGLLNVFPKYFPSKEVAESYARHPEKIANRVYSNRMGNGDEQSGDGWKFRGRGAIQCTGKSIYAAFGLAINEDVCSDPDILLKSSHIALSAAWFFSKNGLNQIADKGMDDNTVKEITKKVNGGYAGLAERQRLFKEVSEKLK